MGATGSAVLGLLLAAQIQIGTVRGRVLDPSGGLLPGARVVLYGVRTDFERRAIAEHGAFELENVPFGLYGLRVEAQGFRRYDEPLRVRTNLPVERNVELALAGPDEILTVRPEERLVDPERVSTTTRLDESFIERLSGGRVGASLQELVATAAGWSTEDNGLLHARGVDDGFLYVSDGIPVQDRVDTLFSTAMDVTSFQTLEILEGHLPAEYGGASGGVIKVVARSGLSQPWGGAVSFRAGSQTTGSASLNLGGSLAGELGLFVSLSYAGSGERFLDPVDPENFNNRGGALRLMTRTDWRVTTRDLLILDLSANGSGFRVTNTLEQELAGQRQRQSLRDDHQSLLWQRTWSEATVTEIGGYRHAFRAELLPSPGDVPVSASQDRRHSRVGTLVNVTHQRGRHTLKAGFDLQRISPVERFSFFVTDEEKAEEAGIGDEALAFDRTDPFVFEGDARRAQGSAFVQDTFTPFDKLTVSAGLRYDRTSMLVADSQWSPRLGAAFYLGRLGATARASYDRLFAPPQVENLLLSSSEEARRLSPFATEKGTGGAEVPPERQHAIEVGLAKSLGNWGLLDVSYWRRDVRNFADPNVFFGTTIVFPNSVASGTASGVDVRLEVPFRRGFSGFLSYGNALVYQRGPINGGLFLEEEVIEIGPGTRFNPDHDQRNVGAFGVTYRHFASGTRLSFSGRHESGTPLEVEAEELEQLMERRGAGLVDLDRMRVKPRTLFDLSVGVELFRGGDLGLDLQLDVRNLANDAFAFNFANPFSGTHFGYPRLLSARVRASF